MTRTLGIAFLMAAVVPAGAHDWLIVPGERVGPVHAKSDEQELRKAFGPAAVKPASIQIDQKTTAQGVEIYSGRPGESLAVVWPREDHGLMWPLLVIPCYGSRGSECRWRTGQGVRVGLRIRELESLNQKPFFLFPSAETHMWTEPWWDEGQLTGHLGEDVELFFPGPEDDSLFVQGVYEASNQPRLSAGNRPIERMLVFLLAPQKAAPAIDWTIGGRTWQLVSSGKPEPLRQMFGAGQVHRRSTEADEGAGNVPAVSIFGDQSDRMVLVRRGFGTLICGGPPGYGHCRWRLGGGFQLIMPLEKLQAINGRAFQFNGFGWDLGGVVTSWEGGHMATKWPGARIAIFCGGQPATRMFGEVQLSSSDPELRKLPCRAEVFEF